ncbi:putative ankyrin repeat-containing domain-containing protein [Helianthus annuus]|nr:putative ankyrin repeat-containing domain-containing protein [Helianthus annuus]
MPLYYSGFIPLFLMTCLDDKSTALDAWNRLKKIYLNQAAALEKTFTNLTLKSMPSLQAYCQKLRELAAQLADVDQPVSESRLIIQLVSGLPAEYDVIAAQLKKDLPPWEDAINLLDAEERRQQARQTPVVAAAVPKPTQPPSNMASSSSALDVSARTEDFKFVHASNVNVSNFVSVKLLGRSNYRIWKAQMLCLIESQMLRGTIDTSFPIPGGMKFDMRKRYDTLVRGWIFGSIDENVLKDMVLIKSARQVWKTLESNYDPSIDLAPAGSSPDFMVRTEFVRVPEIASTENLTRKIKLYEATMEGRWWKAKSILKHHKDAATKAICENGNTMLHLAVEMGHDYFVEQLLLFFKNGEEVEQKNNAGRTALHVAAQVDNTYAAQLLVQNREKLLSNLDYKAQSPLDVAYNNMKLNTYAYFLKFTPQHLSNYPRAYQQNAVKLPC